MDDQVEVLGFGSNSHELTVHGSETVTDIVADVRVGQG